ncbi:MAG: polyprenyl synthetase family protein [Muribaculaceae bacterium]
MNNFEQIRESLAEELKGLNNIIAQSLHSDNTLMECIVNDYLKTKGKQLRPMLSILTGKMFGGDMNTVLMAAASVELLHNASLIHDDVIDESTERRGRPTINRIWDNHMAVLVGDFFVSSSLSCGVASGEPQVVKVLANRGRELSLGEINQIEDTRKNFVSEQKYLDTIKRKTAALFCSCVEVGGYAAKAPAHLLEQIVKYAELFGICFQIKDDIFDYYNDPVIGKPTGNDLREGKRTLPLIHVLSLTHLPQHQEMMALSEKQQLTQQEINTLIQYTKDNGGIEYAEQKMQQLRAQAFNILDQLPYCKEIDIFKALFSFVIERNI